MSAAERILYYVNGSIPNWRVALALHEKGLPFTGRRLRVMGEQRETRSPEFLALNPRGKAPVLVEPGVVINESLAVLHYLEARHPAPPLLPPREEPTRLSRVLARMHESDNLQHVYRPIEALFRLKPEEVPAAERARLCAAGAAVRVELARWEEHAAATAHIADEAFTLADCAFYPILGYLQRRGLVLAPYPALRAYAARVRARPAALAAHPEGWPAERCSRPNLFARLAVLEAMVQR